MGWSRFASEVKVYTVSGDHESIIRKPRVQSVVNTMNHLLRFRPSNEFPDTHDRPDLQEKLQKHPDLAGLMKAGQAIDNPVVS